jgi:hypothetical protein
MPEMKESREFDCVECGRHIVRFAAWDNEPALCAECLFLPGWYKSPGLKQILDPTNEVPDGKE